MSFASRHIQMAPSVVQKPSLIRLGSHCVRPNPTLATLLLQHLKLVGNLAPTTTPLPSRKLRSTPHSQRCLKHCLHKHLLQLRVIEARDRDLLMAGSLPKCYNSRGPTRPSPRDRKSIQVSNHSRHHLLRPRVHEQETSAQLGLTLSRSGMEHR